MSKKKAIFEETGSFLSDITPEHNAQEVQSVQPVQDKRKEKSIERQTGKPTVHVHTLLFKDDLDALKEIAYQKRKSTNELLRDIVSDYIKAQS